jgi:hypothetical protein
MISLFSNTPFGVFVSYDDMVFSEVTRRLKKVRDSYITWNSYDPVTQSNCSNQYNLYNHFNHNIFIFI